MGKRKGRQVNATFPDSVYSDLATLAQEAGVPVATLVSRIVQAWLAESGDRVAREIWDRSRAAREAREGYFRLIGALNRIGANLNQVARWCNVQREIDRAVLEEIERIREAIAHIARDWRPAAVLQVARGEVGEC